ncbi:MAG: 30S ribosomal protein S16 [Cryomorphaceae bacterium]|jgi:small subunit ribosomal protein S16|nr:30S ribosomal protein S16 [Cryomorphaceae bacterium]
MATRIRLQRHGKKGKAFFHLVAADSRAKRDGKFIEKLGTYNPNTNPATIDINFDRTLHWVQVGAEMSDTARAILSYKGILYKNHLLKGVAKGAFTLEQAEAKYVAWATEKDSKISGKKDGLAKSAAADKAARFKAEEEAKAAKAAAIEAKNTVVEEATVEEAEVEAPVAEATEEVAEVEAEATVAEEPAAEDPAAEEATPEEPAAEDPASEDTSTEE